MAALDGRMVEARAGFEDALRRYREIDLPWQIAQLSLGMASVMDIDDPQVRAVAVEGRDIMVRLGATPFVAAMDRLLDRGPARDGRRAAAGPVGNTQTTSASA